MLAYAPRPASRAGSPRTLLLVAAGHALALALVLTARSALVDRPNTDPTDVIFVPTDPPPPPPPSDPNPPREATRTSLDRPVVIIPTPRPPSDPIADGPRVTTVDPLPGPADPGPVIVPLPDPPRPAILRRAARFITPPDEVRPPYPLDKQRLEEEAALRLALVIDAAGRVTSVTPVGAADATFLAAASRHILRHWRYAPATAGGDAVASTIVITLRFELGQ